jgi:fatty acid kinase fatty acid binding subunit
VTVKVITDSSSDLSDEVINDLSIGVVPLTVRFGAEEFVDRRDLTPAEFWARCDASATLPETAAPAPGAFDAAYRAAAADGHDGVVAICISGRLSATLQSAQVAAEAVAGTIAVRVVDSKQASGGLGIIVRNAARWAAGGGKLDEIADGAEEEVGRTRLYATFDTLEYLRKGGRIGRAQALVGSMLSMKPVIELRDGVVEPESRQRTRSRSVRYLADKVREAVPVAHPTVLHADAPDHAELVAMLEEFLPPGDIHVATIGAVIGTHAGPRAMGVAFQQLPRP